MESSKPDKSSNQKPTARFIRLFTGVVVGIAILVAVTWLLGKALAYDRPRLYHGQTVDYWSAQVVASDAAVSNQANALLNSEVIPQLTDQMFHNTNDSKIRLKVIDALNSLPWITYIDPYLASSRRLKAAFDLGAFGPAGKAAIPALMQAVQSSDSAVNEEAIVSLGKIHSRPDVVIPFLIQYLDDDSRDDEAATALGEFGSLARPAVPKIILLLHSTDDDAQEAAFDALKKIDPVALTNATAMPAK